MDAFLCTDLIGEAGNIFFLQPLHRLQMLSVVELGLIIGHATASQVPLPYYAFCFCCFVLIRLISEGYNTFLQLVAHTYKYLYSRLLCKLETQI